MNEKTVGMLIGKKNVYEYPELSNAVTCMNYVNKETEIPPVLMMHGLADDKAWRSGILDREEYGYCGKIFEKSTWIKEVQTVTNAIVILLAVIFGII